MLPGSRHHFLHRHSLITYFLYSVCWIALRWNVKKLWSPSNECPYPYQKRMHATWDKIPTKPSSCTTFTLINPSHTHLPRILLHFKFHTLSSLTVPIHHPHSYPHHIVTLPLPLTLRLLFLTLTLHPHLTLPNGF